MLRVDCSSVLLMFEISPISAPMHSFRVPDEEGNWTSWVLDVLDPLCLQLFNRNTLLMVLILHWTISALMSKP